MPAHGSEFARKAVQHGIALAKRIGAKATALTVLPHFHTLTTDARMIEDTPAPYKARMHRQAEKTSSIAVSWAKSAGVVCETIQVEHEHPNQPIIDAATSKGCDLIFMASHGRHSGSALVPGSETVKVLTHHKTQVPIYQ